MLGSPARMLVTSAQNSDVYHFSSNESEISSDVHQFSLEEPKTSWDTRHPDESKTSWDTRHFSLDACHFASELEWWVSELETQASMLGSQASNLFFKGWIETLQPLCSSFTVNPLPELCEQFSTTHTHTKTKASGDTVICRSVIPKLQFCISPLFVWVCIVYFTAQPLLLIQS